MRKVVVTEEKDLTDLVLELGYGATISGTVSFDNQQVLPSTVTIAATDENAEFSEIDYVHTAYSEGKPVPKKISDFKIESIRTAKFI